MCKLQQITHKLYVKPSLLVIRQSLQIYKIPQNRTHSYIEFNMTYGLDS